jgi:hypothetical protein
MATSENKESAIPVGTGFSPNVIDLPKYLEAIIGHSGDPEAIVEATSTPPVYTGKVPDTERRKRHPMEAGAQYGLLTSGDYKATDLARRFADIDDEETLYEEFARHILLDLGGLRVIEGAREMRMDGRNVTGDDLSEYLTQQGFRVGVHNTAINSIRLWLAKAGLLPEDSGSSDAWLPDPSVKEELVGLSDDMIASIAQLSDKEIKYLKMLCRTTLGQKEWLNAAEVRDAAEDAFGIRYDRQSLPDEVLRPLAEAGLVEYETQGTTSGTSSRVRPTSKLEEDVVERFLENTLEYLNQPLTAYYRKRPKDIYEALEANDPYRKGQALEAYTIYLMRLLGLRFLGWRQRAVHDSHGQVDVLMGGLYGAVPTTWQVQCKNRPSEVIGSDVVAREVGLVSITNATQILIVANAPVKDTAREFAEKVMRKSPVNIYLLDEEDFQKVVESPTALYRILKTQSRQIADLRMSEPFWSGGATGEGPVSDGRQRSGVSFEESGSGSEQRDLFSLTN